MDINYLINNFSDSSKFDEINNNNINHLDIGTLFKLEESLIKNIYKFKNKSKDLDIIFLNYKALKEKIQLEIEKDKKKLVKINIQKEEFDKSDLKRKLLYLTKEYNLLINQTNTKVLIEEISNLEKRIDSLKEQIKDRKITMEYNKIKTNYSKIIIFVNGEKFDNKIDVLPNNLTIEDKILWYEKRIEETIEKKMIFDNYLFSLENLYSNILEKRMLDTTFNK